jgi:anthranilate synthase component 2
VILVVDHYDSFVYNLVQIVQAFEWKTTVIRSDELSAAGAAALAPDGVILSPGPGRPESAGCMVELVRALPADTPVLGVCLGHQALAVALGATVERAPQPVHGKASPVRHTGRPLFAGVPTSFSAGRYHSLVVRREGLPPELSVTAESEDGLVMALEHRERPRFGVQFHPESILTPDGPRIIENFLALAGRRAQVPSRLSEWLPPYPGSFRPATNGYPV